jgi:hypothetical protein
MTFEESFTVTLPFKFGKLKLDSGREISLRLRVAVVV